jgi:hypothetical protein
MTRLGFLIHCLNALEIELGLGLSQIKVFFDKFIHISFHHISLSRAFRQLIEKPKRFIDFYIVFYKNPKFIDCRSKNGDNTRLRRTDK